MEEGKKKEIYKVATYAGGYRLEIELVIENDDIQITYLSSSLVKKMDYKVHGKIISKNPNYHLVKVLEIDNEKLKYSPFLDIYIFENKNLTDDYYGLTEINCANTPSFNKYFDCVIYLNKQICWDISDIEMSEKINRLDNVKLFSGKSERSGWDWKYHEDEDKIRTERY